MGSQSDFKTMKLCQKVLKLMKVKFETKIISAHRTPDRMIEYAKKAEKNNISVIIAGAGGSAHLPGMTAALTSIPVIGVPGTIDNDIYGTSHTIGYDTALNTVVEAIDKIRDTASSHDRLFFIEVMGRDAGFIALNTGIGAGAEEILIPEENLGLDRLLDSLEKSRRSGKNSSIVIVSEGDKIGKNVFQLADYVKENLPYYDAKVTVLGHIQRGGIPSCFDRVLASRMSVKAVELLLDGQKNVMVGLKDDDIITCPLDDVIHEKPKINKDLLRISEILST